MTEFGSVAMGEVLSSVGEVLSSASVEPSQRAEQSPVQVQDCAVTFRTRVQCHDEILSVVLSSDTMQTCSTASGARADRQMT